jgi:hypothetical protein
MASTLGRRASRSQHSRNRRSSAVGEERG